MTESSAGERDALKRPEVRWGLGCLVASAALVGVMILVFLVALALTPPRWVQVLLGVGLAAGGALLAWLVANALGQSRARSGGAGPMGPRPVDAEQPRSDEARQG